MVVCQWITGYIVVYPRTTGYYDLFGQFQTVYRNMGGGGCKIYERRGGAEPSIYFTNPPYFYRPSGTDQISVLFRLGPWIVYAITKISKKKFHRLHTYTAVFFVRKYDVTACADDVIDGAVKIKDDTTLCRCKKQWKNRRYLVVKPLSSKSEVNASKTCRFCYICIQNISESPEDPIATGRFPPSWISQ